MSEAHASRCTEALHRLGFVVIGAADGSSGLVSRELCRDCTEAALSLLSGHLDRVREVLDIDPTKTIFNFHEICQRADRGLRYDMKVQPSANGALWHRLFDRVDRVVSPMLARARMFDQREAESGEASLSAGCGSINFHGVVVAAPGAPTQHYHPDGMSAGVVNVFIPLVDVDHINGPTEFKAGTHKLDHTAAWPTSRANPPEIAPHVRMGECLVFDYRTLHRGRANHSDLPRPVAYYVRSKPDVTDGHNFPRESLYADVVERAAQAHATSASY